MPDQNTAIFAALLVLPLLSCLAIVLLVPGIEPSLTVDGLKVGAGLVAGALVLSYAASALASRSADR